MDLHVNKVTEESESPAHGRRSELSLLNMLTETIRRLQAVRHHGAHGDGEVGGRRSRGEGGSEGGMLGPAADQEDDGERGRKADEEQEERKSKQRVLGVLWELSVFHSDRVAAWRGALRESVHQCPPGGSDQMRPSSDKESEASPCSDSVSETLLSVGDDLDNIVDKLNSIRSKLNDQILKLCAEEASLLQEAPQQPGDENNPLNSCDSSDCALKEDSEDGDDQSEAMTSPDTGQASDWRLIHDEEADSPQETEKDIERVQDKEETNNKWITVGFAGEQEERQPHWCFIRAAVGVAELLTCEPADALSGLMVTDSEELISRVIRVKVQDGAHVHFPVTVIVPFCACYRGNYRDVAVKIVDGERRASYITPVTTEGSYGGQRGSFAEVRVYSLGLFAVVSCLKRENYTVPTKGLSLKLSMDPRLCVNYLPGSFTAPVLAQTMIQPVDAVLLAAVKSRGDAYQSVVSTSPLLYLTHPSSQPLRRPLTLVLPCPPNPDKKMQARGQEEEQDNRSQPVGALPWEQAAFHRRVLAASLKSKEMSNELLVVLGLRDKQWAVLDKVPVRNQQNGLVSFEITENFDRLLVVRLLSPLQSCHLTSLAEELEESACCHAVTIVLQRRQNEPHVILVAVLPSRDLTWELSRLRAQGYSGFPEASTEISMHEGDQLLLCFSGNITSAGSDNDRHDIPHERITFHSQQKNHLLVRLTEVDPFGNYSSPHYKGTAMFHKVTRGQLGWQGDEPVLMDTKLLGDPVCKLSLTLPKKVRPVNRTVAVRVKSCEETDSLSDSVLLWLSGELSEEDLSLLVLSLRLRRSAAQLVRLRAGDSLSTQAFHVLAMWRRGLPAAMHQPKASQLAHCLAKSGRPDLARELLLRQAAGPRPAPLSLKSRNHTAI